MQIEQVVRQVVARCIEEMLDAEMTELLPRSWYGRRTRDDVEEEIRERYGWGMSLRWLKRWLDRCLKSSVGLRAPNERLRAMPRLVPRWRRQVLDHVPPVV